VTFETETPDACDVAIVGAGPIGLLLAGELAAHGIRVVILERADSPSLVPKANGIVGHAAVELEKLGVLAGTGLHVVSPPRFQFGPLALKLGYGPGNPLHILPIPQRRLEELLELRAIKRGAQLRRGHEVIGFTQSDAAVTVRMRPGQTTTQLETQYLVGCDGAHSLVRKQAGIGFPGFTSDQIAYIARVTIPSNHIARTGDSFDIAGVGLITAMRPNQLAGGGFSIAPAAALDPNAPPDLYLISAHEPRGDSEPSDDVSVDDLRAALRRVLGADLPFTDAFAIRTTVGNSRQADSYRAGRVFLAGDAAHIFNAGGSALNVGLQDALEVARCLTAVLRGGASDDQLDRYELVRRPSGERTLRHTRAQAALGRNDEISRALRETLSEALAGRGAGRRIARMIEEA
jgi:2-polyprenyl-6-methoxyphenol hydroxylase-like FAD-dependent oxidoreductase